MRWRGSNNVSPPRNRSPPDNGLAEALTAIGGAVEQARTATSAALDGFALEAALAPLRKGIRVIREISWRWREIGADGRICDLIDSQTGAIEAGCEQISSSDPRASLRAAFDLISQELDKFGDREAASQGVEEAIHRSGLRCRRGRNACRRGDGAACNRIA